MHPENFGTPPFCGVNVGVVQEKLRHAPGNNMKEDLALNTEERDDPKLLNGT